MDLSWGSPLEAVTLSSTSKKKDELFAADCINAHFAER
jgi:hypothetical protein